MRQLRVWQSFPVCKIKGMCTRATTGISVLILYAFSSMESEGVSAYAKTRQKLLYSLLQSMDVLRIQVAYSICSSLRQPSIFSFLLSLLIFISACWNLFIFCKVYTREFEKRPLLKIFSLEEYANYETCAKMFKMHRFQFSHIFRDYLFYFEINEYFHYLFIFLGGGGVKMGGCGGGNIRGFY